MAAANPLGAGRSQGSVIREYDFDRDFGGHNRLVSRCWPATWPSPKELELA
jgi:hypothetical protein